MRKYIIALTLSVILIGIFWYLSIARKAEVNHDDPTLIEEGSNSDKDGSTINNILDYGDISAPLNSQVLFYMTPISENEYVYKRNNYYKEEQYFWPSNYELSERVTAEDGCYSFLSSGGFKSDITLCDYTPSPKESEAAVVDYRDPFLIKELNSYFIIKGGYEGANLYLLNYDYPHFLDPIYGYPIISPNFEYFFTLGNQAGGYGDSTGLEIWKIENEHSSKITTFAPGYFLRNGPEEVFWVEDEIYLNIYHTEKGEPNGFMKISFSR